PARYLLSLHDALPISASIVRSLLPVGNRSGSPGAATRSSASYSPSSVRAGKLEGVADWASRGAPTAARWCLCADWSCQANTCSRSEEHTSELQSRENL